MRPTLTERVIMLLTIKEQKELDRKTYMRANWEWIEEQLKSVGYSDTPNGEVVKHIIKVLEETDFKQENDEQADKVIAYALDLFKGHALEVVTDEEWTTDLGGNLNVRDTVRVLRDAYTGIYATEHNGKRGRVVVMRNGYASVVYDGENIETPTQHAVKHLEKLVIK